MTCVHLQQLYRLCQEHDLKLGGADLIHIVCNQCGVQDVCPSMLSDEYDARHPQPVTAERHDNEEKPTKS